MNAALDNLGQLRLFLTTEHACSYLPPRAAQNLVADPAATDQQTYSALARLGFRRSGNHIYRPHCPGCEACLSLRIPVQAFRPNRAQRRTWQRNRDIRVIPGKPRFRIEHFELFTRYLEARHRDGGMDHTTPEGYLGFMASSWSNTRLYEMRLGPQLLAVAAVDYLHDGLSSVYTFFDPNETARSLGTYSILWQIKEAESLGMAWVYLGYWVQESRKMAYKANFRPHELFVAGRWIPASLQSPLNPT